MKIIKKIKKIMFGIHELTWWVVSQIEDWLYPYCDRPVEYEYDEDSTSEISFLKSQMESANERIQRLQTEMIHVQSTVDSLTDKRKIIIKNK
tara:strand:- start:1740 stop:2015 length:276 start_codon:yes stop_codon:yes gene_type:complete